MKKLLMTFLSLALLTGCAQNNVESQDRPNVNHAPGENGLSKEEVDKAEQGTTNGVDSLPEFELLSKHIDLTLYTGVVETDNPGNRVILFEDLQGVKIYKSILVKNDNFLKIIKLDDDELLFKGTID